MALAKEAFGGNAGPLTIYVGGTRIGAVYQIIANIKKKENEKMS